MSAVELKALHDSFVELWMQQPYGCCLDFFHTVFTPACEEMASCSRGRGKLPGTVCCKAEKKALQGKANVSLCLPSMLPVFLLLLSQKLD